MRLLVDARVGWGHGIGRVIANTVPRVAALRPDWTLTALVPDTALEAAQTALGGEPNLTVIGTDIRPFSAGEQLGLRRYAAGHDLTWFTNYWVPLTWQGRFVSTVHDMLHLLPGLAPASRLNRQLARLTFEKVRRHAAAVMFDSRFTEGEFHSLVGGPSQRGVTVPLGGDHLCYPPIPKRRQLLAVAAPKKHKNFALLLRAWEQARVGSDWRLHIVAPAEAMRSTVDIEAMVVAARGVEIHRSLSNERLAQLFAESAVMLTPSLYEGFGLPLLEGLLAGCLCVSSTAGSLVEVAEGSFVLFANGRDRKGWTNAIERACALIDGASPALAALLDDNKRQASRFTWAATASQIVDVLEHAHG